MNTVICFLLCIINIPFIVQDPSRWFSWCAVVFAFGMGIVSAEQEGRE